MSINVNEQVTFALRYDESWQLYMKTFKIITTTSL